MSFLGLYRDPVIATVTSRCDWRIDDMVSGNRPTTLYLVVPPSDINRTKPLVRLLLNQIGRRLTEDLNAKSSRHRLLLMLDEFPALGRLDFFESALAFMAGYGLKTFLIAQSLNQIERAYGPNNSILDNCHVRVSFATNDERTAKRVSDALGTATEMRAMKNYAGHRLSPWLGHLMVSRQETARALLTPGEVMQLPPSDEIIMVAGINPIRAQKARYYEDARFAERILSPPELARFAKEESDDWSHLTVPTRAELVANDFPSTLASHGEDSTESEKRRQPELSSKLAADSAPVIADEFDVDRDTDDDAPVIARALGQSMQKVARQADLDPDDGML
jgi:type IV secretion system protein VirD4